MSRIEHDETSWPLVVVRFPPSASSDEDIEQHIADQRRLLSRRQRFVQIIDASHAPVISARQRKRFSEWIEESKLESKRYCLGLAAVVPNPIVRGAMQAVLWLVTPPMPVKMFARIEECAAQCQEWLESGHVEDRQKAAERLHEIRRRGSAERV